MANVSRHLLTVTSNAGAATFSNSVRVGGEAMDIQFTLAPGNNCILQVSPDNVTWAVAEDNSGAAITGLGAVARNVGTQAEYARMSVAVAAVAAYAGVLTVRKEIGT
jgi:hypothetical protein